MSALGEEEDVLAGEYVDISSEEATMLLAGDDEENTDQRGQDKATSADVSRYEDVVDIHLREEDRLDEEDTESWESSANAAEEVALKDQPKAEEVTATKPTEEPQLKEAKRRPSRLPVQSHNSPLRKLRYSHWRHTQRRLPSGYSPNRPLRHFPRQHSERGGVFRPRQSCQSASASSGVLLPRQNSHNPRTAPGIFKPRQRAAFLSSARGGAGIFTLRRRATESTYSDRGPARRGNSLDNGQCATLSPHFHRRQLGSTPAVARVLPVDPYAQPRKELREFQMLDETSSREVVRNVAHAASREEVNFSGLLEVNYNNDLNK